MARHIRVKGIKRKEVDEDKLALAFLMLAKVMLEQNEPQAERDSSPDDREAA
jgi:hypothetical protein